MTALTRRLNRREPYRSHSWAYAGMSARAGAERAPRAVWVQTKISRRHCEPSLGARAESGVAILPEHSLFNPRFRLLRRR